MKKYFKVILVVLFVHVVVISCNTGKQMLENGNYYGAVMSSVEKLRNSPDNKKARLTLEDAYPYAVNTFIDKLENISSSPNQFMNTEAVYIYEDLNRMHESVQHCPAAREVIVNPKKFYTQLGNVKQKAAEEQYSAGIELLSLGSRDNAKRAFFYFKKANVFVENYKDVNDKIEDSYNLALLHVLADLKPIQSRLYKLSANVFYTEVNKVFESIEQNEFVRFYSPEEMKKMNLDNPDQVLKINFEDFVVGETHTKEWMEKVQSDSVKVSEITLKNGDKRDVYDIVSAEVHIHRMQVISKGIISFEIHEDKLDNRPLVQENLRGNYVWYNEWGNYNGDKRALTEAQLVICKSKRITPIPPQQMFVEFTKPIHDQLRRKLVNYYDNY